MAVNDMSYRLMDTFRILVLVLGRTQWARFNCIAWNVMEIACTVIVSD